MPRIEADDELAQAIKEAYASAPTDVVVLETLEIWHSTFAANKGGPGHPVRVVRYPVVGQSPAEFRLPIEETAEHDPGEVVTFYGIPFEISVPEKSQDTPGQFTIALGGAGTLLEPYLEKAAVSGGVISATVRTYVKGAGTHSGEPIDGDGPRDVWGGIQLASPYVDNKGNIQVKGSLLNWLNRKFGRLYTPNRYPALAGRG